MLQDARMELTGIGEGLPLTVGDVQKPFPAAGFEQTGGYPLAVVEDVRHFVDDEVRCWLGITEVERRHEAGRLLAEPNQRNRLGTEQLGSQSPEVKIGEHPGGAVP